MKTWKKIIGATVLTGVAFGAVAYFAKKKSLEDNFSDEFDNAFEDFDDELAKKSSEKEKNVSEETERDYVPIDLENEQENADKAKESSEMSNKKESPVEKSSKADKSED